jgi:predicted methyltransferase
VIVVFDDVFEILGDANARIDVLVHDPFEIPVHEAEIRFFRLMLDFLSFNPPGGRRGHQAGEPASKEKSQEL